ncbi:MAG: hypothetical protein ABIR17_08465 [Pseudolysinimonas sp.]|uniref:hypothetical protein n=1 Tax=Pseudolysinimonas sp. TaxID=2680009 RepID=UPI003262F26F
MLPPPVGPAIDTTPPSHPAPPSAATPLASADPVHDARPRRRIPIWPFLLGAMAFAVLGGMVAAVLAVTPDRIQWFHDSYVAWAQPIPADVAAIADETGMSPEGELIFRASTPDVEEGTEFNANCSVEGGAVLGCYYQGNIFIYHVTDARLAGTAEVTGAHEMLHAAYERLSDSERAAVDKLVAARVAEIPADDPVYQDMALYPDDQLASEWHSRLGTEFADLSPDLEAHYALYFDDRTKVVALNVKSTAAFRELQAKIDALVTEIDASAPQLDARIAAYEAKLDAFNSDVTAYNNRVFDSQEEATRQYNALNHRGAALDAEYATLDTDIQHYNSLVDQLTTLDSDYADLYSALDPSDDPETITP